MTSTYELRVEGRLGAPLIRRLGACGHAVARCTVLRLRASPAELEQFLAKCQEAGVEIQRLRYAMEPRLTAGRKSPEPDEAR